MGPAPDRPVRRENQRSRCPPREALVELHDRAAQLGLAPTKVGHRLGRVVQVRQVFVTLRHHDASSPKRGAAAALGSPVGTLRVACIKRNVERNAQVALESASH